MIYPFTINAGAPRDGRGRDEGGGAVPDGVGRGHPLRLPHLMEALGHRPLSQRLRRLQELQRRQRQQEVCDVYVTKILTQLALLAI